ncbi:MAG: FMN-binding protein [Lentisphaeria bacterium]|nr:FMN-binding protein [Lentisphaeria bacterium]
MSTNLRKKSGIIYLSVFLLLICAVATAAMSLVAVMTENPIRERQAAMIQDTLKLVLPQFVSLEEKTEAGKDFTLFTAKDQNGKITGYAVRAVTTQGYGGRVEALVGFLPDGAVYNIVVTSHNETPGIGTKVMNREQIKTISDVIGNKKAPEGLPKNRALDSYKGKTLKEKLSRDNVHFISGATVSSNAMLDLVNTARMILQQTIQGVK